MATMDARKILTAGDLQRILTAVDPGTPICGYGTTSGVDCYRYYFDGVSYEKGNESQEDAGAGHHPISGPVIILTGEITIKKTMEDRNE